MYALTDRPTAPAGIEIFQGWEYASGDLDFDRDAWYYWSCEPGSMPTPDSEAGPFSTFEDAVADACEEELEAASEEEAEYSWLFAHSPVIARLAGRA